MLKFLFLIHFMIIAMPQPIAATGLVKDSIFKNLTSGEFEEKLATIEKIIASGDKNYFSLLNAILDNNLYAIAAPDGKEILVIPVKNKDNTYTVMEVKPFQPLKINGQTMMIQEAGLLKEVKFNRVVRNRIQEAIPDLRLYHWSKERRIEAIKEAGTTGRQDYIRVLDSIQKREPDYNVQKIIRETTLHLMLYSSDKQIRKNGIIGLAGKADQESLSILREHLSDRENDSSLKALTISSIENIEATEQKKEILQNLFTGLSLGSILILMALGLAIIYGLMGIINMAHGEFMMIGAYSTFVVQSFFISYIPQVYFEYYFWAALPFSFLVSGTIGIFTEYLIIRFLYQKPLESLLATWGVSLILIQTARTIFGDLTAVKTPAFASGGMEVMSSVVFPYSRIFIIAVTLCVVGAVRYILHKTTFGLKIRAVTQNRNMAACLGIPTTKVNRYSFFLGTGIAGIAGWALTLISNVVPNMGQTYIVDSFLVVVTGGVGKLLGTVLSGLGMGFTTKILESLFQAVYGKVLILILVILFLQIKPTGLFPAKGRSEE